MGILSSILNKIFPSANAAPVAPPAADVPAAPEITAIDQVDVEHILNGMAQQSAEQLNWHTSIVDLLKLLHLDSGMASRKELAQELHYTGDMNDSASMNIWLHRQVMNKLAANGGKVPADLLS